jgi:hypothetical protein
MLQVITSENTCRQVFEAIDNKSFLVVGQTISLDYLASDYDGCFPSMVSWKTFCNKNFDNDLSVGGGFYYEGDLKSSIMGRWTHKLNDFKDLFVVYVGGDQYIKVDFDKIELSLKYELQFNSSDDNLKNKQGISYPSAVEFWIEATLKDSE